MSRIAATHRSYTSQDKICILSKRHLIKIEIANDIFRSFASERQRQRQRQIVSGREKGTEKNEKPSIHMHIIYISLKFKFTKKLPPLSMYFAVVCLITHLSLNVRLCMYFENDNSLRCVPSHEIFKCIIWSGDMQTHTHTHSNPRKLRTNISHIQSHMIQTQ